MSLNVSNKSEKCVRIYLGEEDRWHGKLLFRAVLERLLAEGCPGATVVRGVAGFGASAHIHTATTPRLSENLPIVVEWVDSTERVESVLPMIQTVVGLKLITVEDVHAAPRAAAAPPPRGPEG